MAEDKKPETSNQPLTKSIDFNEVAQKRNISESNTVSNTLPAPPNPHRNDGETKKKG